MFQPRIRARFHENMEENGLESAPNPMMNLVILTKVFNLIPFRLQDFQEFRLVCRVWMEASLPRWRRNAWLSVRDHNCYRRSNNHLKIRECQKLENLLGKHPFRRYKISLTKCLHLSESIYRLGEGSATFWSQFGSHITHLKLYDTQIISKEAVKKILLEMTPNLIFICFENNPINDKNSGVVPLPLTEDEWSNCIAPTWHDKLAPLPFEVQNNLNHLEIRLGSGTKGFEFPVAWVYFLARCPNLKTLKLREFSQWFRWGTLGEELEYFLRAILLIRERCNPACLEKLQVLDLLHSDLTAESSFPTDVVLLLRDLRFPLSSLAVDVGYQSGVDVFKQILELYPHSLKKLLLYVGPVISRIRRPQFNQFPLGVDFNALTELRLIGPTVKNLHFLQNFSNLRVLVLLSGLEVMETVLHSYVDFWRDRVNDKVFGFHASVLSETVYHVVNSTNFLGEELHNCVLSKMREFVVGNELCNAEQVMQLGKLMPNLKKLRLGLEREGFISACRIWTQLEHLDLEPFEIDGDGILGVLDAQLVQRPSLIDLKFLTWFRVGPPLIGKRDSGETEKLLKLITKTFESTPNTKELHFSGTARRWNGLGGQALISPIQVFPK